ncbi:MAG: hypothetical protein LBC18_15085, partial [Opitutaceae bacterium]|nr:hypothetical protein [Opitutaceae bacterium]
MSRAKQKTLAGKTDWDGAPVVAEPAVAYGGAIADDCDSLFPADNIGALDAAFLAATAAKSNNAKKHARTGTFTDNLQLPVHRWFRYSAGFSAKWVESVMLAKKTRRLFDPFAGSGTSLLAADALGIPSDGAESHPFVHRVASAKISWDFDVAELAGAARELKVLAQSLQAVENRTGDPLLGRIYTPQNLDSLERLRVARETLENSAHYSRQTTNLLWLAITSILRACSFAGTAQWQYVLPAKTKSREKEPFAALDEAVDRMIEDRRFCALESWQKKSTVIPHDSRQPFPTNTNSDRVSAGTAPVLYDTVITSPPYPNNYDYADATRIEMTFWKDIAGWSDLQAAVRVRLMRSCSQHAAAERLKLETLLSASRLAPIRGELSAVCERLAKIRLTKGGKKTYHTMVAAYFSDLSDVFCNLRKITTAGADLCF